MADVQALGMDVVTEKSGHSVVGMAVSVCITPAAPSPLPMPYPLTASVSEGIADSPLRTKICGVNCATIGSVLKTCHGNEPGTLKEVVSLNTSGPVAPVTGAFTVLIELGPAAITGSLCDMNKAPTPGAGSSGSDASGTGGGGGGGGAGGGAAGGPSGPSGPTGGGSGAGGSAAGASATAGASQHEKDIAAKPGNTPEQIAARKKVASDFYDAHGQRFDRASGTVQPLTADQKAAELKCIDYNKPVQAGPPPPIPSPCGQWQAPGGNRGNFFAPPGTPPGQLGIGANGTAWNEPGQPVAAKQETQHDVNPSTPYLQSTASPANDTWSTPGQAQPAPGGGTQYYVPQGCDPNSTSVQ
jgi:hypothetical protein